MTGNLRGGLQRLTIVVGAVLGAASSGLYAQSERPSLTVQLDRQKIYEGESVKCVVEVMNFRTQVTPDITPLQEFFDVELLGDSAMNSSLTINDRGQIREIRKLGHQYHYQLTPKSAGRVQVPSLVIDLDGENVRSLPQILVVQEPEDQDLVYLLTEAEPVSVYPMQPFKVTLKVFIRKLPGRFVNDDPLSPLWRRPPALEIPWVQDIDGLNPTISYSDWLSPMISQERKAVGFAVNNLRSQGNFFSIFDDSSATFLFKGRPANEVDVVGTKLVGRGDQYWVYTLARDWTALRSGRYDFGPVSIKGTFAADLSRDQFVPKDLFAIARTKTVVVKNVPLEGRPSAFTGGIGDLNVRAEANPSNARVGDPITFTVMVSGDGNLDEVLPLDLNELEDFSSKFRVHEATTESKGSRRIFTYSLRAKDDSVSAIPPYPLSYFDVNEEVYKVRSTAVIPLTVEAASKLDQSEIVSSGTSGDPGSALEASEGGLLGNIVDSREVRVPSISILAHTCSWAGWASLYALLSAWVQRRQRLRGDTAHSRRKKALARAKSRLSLAKAAFARGEGSSAVVELRGVFTGLVSDVVNRTEAGMTKREVEEHLESLGVDSELATRMSSIIEDCDAAEYGAGTHGMSSRTDEVSKLIESFWRTLKKKGTL